jgi:hypothetical protein
MPRTLAVLAAALSMLAPAYSKDKHGNGKEHGNESYARTFRPADRSVIHGHYRGNGRGLPPGLAKRNGDLPPGLEKQLRRNGKLPPGLENRLAPFPAEIESRLPPCPPETRRGLIGGVAVMYSSRTGLILDAFAITSR